MKRESQIIERMLQSAQWIEKSKSWTPIYPETNFEMNRIIERATIEALKWVMG